MLGRSKPVVFDPYRGRRPRRRVPSWLVLLLTGVATGAGGLFFLQERYLPPRLSPAESAALRSAYEAADAQARRLQGELTAAQQQRDAALAEGKRQSAELSDALAAATDLRADMASLVATLPPDPRDNRVEVRAARFEAEGGKLDYDVVLTRPRAAGKPLSGVLQLSVTGESGQGGPSTFSPEPVKVSIGSHEVVRGQVALPEGFRPQQTTVRVLDRAGGHPMGMRVMLVK
ncbi:MAG: hypothetical protein ACOZJX_12700 [Pseudomonadota bacterium]